MSRIDDEYIVALVRNRSGIDSGCLDYSIACNKLDNLNLKDLEESSGIMVELSARILERMEKLRNPIEAGLEYNNCKDCGANNWYVTGSSRVCNRCRKTHGI